MIGQFIFPTCEAAGLRVAAYLRNTPRGEMMSSAPDLAVDLQVFEHGTLVAHEPTFGVIPLGGVLEVSERTCAALASSGRERLVVARCSTPDGSETYFPQEHHLSYENVRTGVFDSLLYDQLPIVKPGRRASPIILLAPKAWVGRDLNSFVAFANVGAPGESSMQSEPLVISVLRTTGELLTTQVIEEPVNSALLFDVHAALGDDPLVAGAPTLVNVVARGGASKYAIMTFVVNHATGNFALEHSLSPHYYVTDGLARVRSEALSTLIPASAS
ncbi:MAG TPA: hypothetical protein VGT98_12960 [Candidatus Elarobacter sp.]|nr:hypothetical protein [Candidatus Elarobacter sp.]